MEVGGGGSGGWIMQYSDMTVQDRRRHHHSGACYCCSISSSSGLTPTCSMSRRRAGWAAWRGSVSQTCCDSIERRLFTERSSEQDQLNIYCGGSIDRSVLVLVLLALMVCTWTPITVLRGERSGARLSGSSKWKTERNKCVLVSMGLSSASL